MDTVFPWLLGLLVMTLIVVRIITRGTPFEYRYGFDLRDQIGRLETSVFGSDSVELAISRKALDEKILERTLFVRLGMNDIFTLRSSIATKSNFVQTKTQKINGAPGSEIRLHFYEDGNATLNAVAHTNGSEYIAVTAALTEQDLLYFSNILTNAIDSVAS